jgi:hypothetical protein
MVLTKVGKSDREGTFSGAHGNSEVAPIRDLPALAPERGASTHSGRPSSAGGSSGRVGNRNSIESGWWRHVTANSGMYVLQGRVRQMRGTARARDHLLFPAGLLGVGLL